MTYGEAFGVQPFGNSLVTMTLTGAQIDELLDQQWVGQTSPAHPAGVGGIHLHVGRNARLTPTRSIPPPS